jgi:hypothetical protein
MFKVLNKPFVLKLFLETIMFEWRGRVVFRIVTFLASVDAAKERKLFAQVCTLDQ